jgi:Flp pilus assembly protein TadG
MAAHVEAINYRPETQAPKRLAKKDIIDRFGRDEHGSILILSLFLLVLMLMIAGMSVDQMRAETQSARLQSTLDRAVLAGASLEQTLDSEDVVRDYFAKAGLTEFLTDVTVVEGSNPKP